MRLTTTFDVTVPRERVAAYLADPRNLVISNHDAPVLDRSDGPLGAGSWFDLGFQQLRGRVEYTAYDPPRTIAVKLTMTGRGSGGLRSAYGYALSDTPDGGTRIVATAEGEGGLIRWAPLTRVAQSLSWRRLRGRIEASA